VCMLYDSLCHKAGIAAEFNPTMAGEATNTQDAWNQGFGEILGAGGGIAATVIPGTSAASELRAAAEAAIADFEAQAGARLGLNATGIRAKSCQG
jgi:hypothetical protein